MKPYAPTLMTTAARARDPAVGASVCASGSHVWKGTNGVFTAKATKKPRNSSLAVIAGRARCWSSRKSNVLCPSCAAAAKYRNRIETSRNADPAMV